MLYRSISYVRHVNNYLSESYLHYTALSQFKSQYLFFDYVLGHLKKPKKKSGNKSGKNILHEGKPWKRVQPYYLPVTLIASAVIVLLIAYLVYPFVDPTTGMSDSTSTKSSPVETPISEIKPTPFGDHEMSLTEADIFSPDKTGRRIVELCIEKLNSSEFNMPNDNQFMKRVAYVMSEFGKNLKSNAGGIWQVTPAAFEDTMDTTSHIRLPRKYQKIRKAYNIDWEKRQIQRP